MTLRSTFASLAFTTFTLLMPFAGRSHADEQEKLTIPDPTDVTLDTNDGVQLRCTYYPGGVFQVDEKTFKKVDGKNVVPIILIHGWEGQRGDFDELAKALQRRGHASIIPDLRGHGSSTTQQIPGRDMTRTLSADKMNKLDVVAMITADLEAVKSFLMKENNAGNLNIEMLCVIGSQTGAMLAMNWSFRDWSWPQLPSIKQGQDVKALVLLSPDRQFKGITSDEAMRHPAIRSQLSVMIVSGRQSPDYADAKRIFDNFERYHEKPPSDRKERLEKQDLFFISPDTTLSGTKLLKGPGLNIDQNIAVFIDLRLVRKQDQFKWQDRSNPLSGG